MTNTISIWGNVKKWLIITVIIVIAVVLMRSCYYNIKETRADSVRQRQQDSIKNSRIIWEDINFEKEKAVLTSISIGLEPDTSVLIIKEYLKSYNSDEALYSEENNINVDSLITVISNKYKVSKRKTATLIYVYKHGTIVKFEDNPNIESEYNNEY